jgi:hypothetical protein
VIIFILFKIRALACADFSACHKNHTILAAQQQNEQGISNFCRVQRI